MSNQVLSRARWLAPALVAFPFLTGADGNGCGGKAFTSGSDSGSISTQRGDSGNASACMPSDCANLAAPADAKVCPGGVSLGATVCVEQSDGSCGWGFPPCPDAGGGGTCATAPLPCPVCANGSSPESRDSNGCYTCGTCPPEEDSGTVVCSCPNEPVPTTCPDGSKQGTTQGPAPCHCPELVPCPGADASADGAMAPCTSNADCAQGYSCAFPESEGCSAQGTCFSVPAVGCDAYLPGCACNGTETNLTCNGLPSGYALAPLRHTGACVDGG